MILGDVLLNYMTWEEAKSAEKDGWRLPTLEELKELYITSKDKFGNYGCWSSTKYDDVHYWSLGFHTGNTYINPKNNLNYVRLVKTSLP